MTDDAKTPDNAEPQNWAYEERDPFFYAEPDGVLAILVEICNGHEDTSMGITLLVGGALVTGTLVHYRRFHEAVVGLMEGGKGPGAEGMARAYQRLMLDEPGEKPEFELRPRTRTAHLVDARVLQGGRLTPANRGMPIRVRLSEVGGWMLGALSED